MDNENRFSAYAAFEKETPFDFSRYSSVGCGGNAEIAFTPRSVSELAALLRQLEKDGIEYYVLGNLTNVLPSDNGTERAVIRTKNLNGITVTGNGAFVYAGATSGALLAAYRREKKSGVEFLNGVPCTLGGALYMNAGAGGKYIGEIVENVFVYRNGETRFLSAAECGYEYKKSVFMENGDVILGASLRLDPAEEEEILTRENYYAARRAHLPKGRSMGCVFKNPVGGYAGDLIERSGLKGMRIGGAKISEEHANFIINDQKAKEKDIRELIALAKNAVRAQYGVILEEEIRYLT